MKKIYNSLQFKMSLIILLFAICPLILSSIIFINRTEKSLISEQKNSVDKQLSMFNDNIDSIFNDLLNNVSEFANESTIKKSDDSLQSYVDNQGIIEMTPSQNGEVERAIFRRFREFGEAHPNYQYVYMGTKYGGYIQYPEGNMDGSYDPRQRSWYPKAMENPNEAVLGKPYYFATDDIVIVGGSQVLKDDSGNIVGVVALDMSLDKVTNLLKKASENFYGYFLLVEDDGTVIADPNNSENNFEKLEEVYGSELSGLVSSSASYEEISLDGKTYLIKSVKSNETGWNYVALVDKNAMLSQLNALRNIVVVIVLVASGLSVLLGIIVSKKISNPIKEIVNVANKVADGDFYVEINTKASGEVETLIQSFKRIGVTLVGYKEYIQEISDILNQIANGNMDFKLHSEYIGEFAKIKSSLLNISNNLTETLKQVKISSNQISAGSEQISEGAQSLAQGATEQASSIEELSASMYEISERTRQNADKAGNVNILSQETGKEIESCNNKMNEMTKAMQEIISSSNQINNIIKTIDDIAFQTNILALNAAVEAARAGSAGKGFAVVADEVRSLAQKSAEAAKSTNTLIESTIKAVENGGIITEETAKYLLRASEKAQQTSHLVLEIASDSQEQAEKISQITTGIDQISTVVQTNSATAEESSASSQELSSQAFLMKNIVEQFKLSDDTEESKSLEESIF